MTFEQAVRKTPGLSTAYQKGLKALRAEDRLHVSPEDSRALRGSVDVDAALQPSQPNAHRWDFAIAYQHTNRRNEVVYWAEMHTASDKEFERVMKKAAWLKDWLLGEGSILGGFEKSIVWVSSGRTRLSLSAPQGKQMALLGLKQVGSTLRLRNRRD